MNALEGDEWQEGTAYAEGMDMLDEVPMVPSAQPWCFSLELEAQMGAVAGLQDVAYLMVDSGACVHACPRDFADWNLVENAPQLVARMADGREVRSEGQRKVMFDLETGHTGQANFHVMPVARAILSVGAMCADGFKVHLDGGTGPYVEKFGEKNYLVKEGNLFFLPVGCIDRTRRWRRTRPQTRTRLRCSELERFLFNRRLSGKMRNGAGHSMSTAADQAHGWASGSLDMDTVFGV